MPRASLKTVAAAAGVSVSSVSNAYNRPEQLSVDVRERILTVAREQGYVGPDAVAASLRNKRAGAIGVILTDRLSYAFEDPFSVEFLSGLTEVAEQFRVGLLLIPFAAADDGSAESAARRAVIDGAISYAVPLDHPALRVIRDRGLPIASTTHDDGESVLTAHVDEAIAAEPIGRHIRDLGHRRVVIAVSGLLNDDGPGVDGRTGLVDAADVRRSAGRDWPERLTALLNGLGDGIDIRYTSGGGWNSRAAGLTAGRAALDLDPRPTAILAATDVLALGVLDALAERGLEPGVDISVTGFDGIPEAATAGLTTVEQPIRERGRLMARMLLDPDFTERRVILPTRFAVRRSTGQPADL